MNPVAQEMTKGNVPTPTRNRSEGLNGHFDEVDREFEGLSDDLFALEAKLEPILREKGEVSEIMPDPTIGLSQAGARISGIAGGVATIRHRIALLAKRLDL